MSKTIGLLWFLVGIGVLLSYNSIGKKGSGNDPFLTLFTWVSASRSGSLYNHITHIDINIHEIIKTYLKSLGAIPFIHKNQEHSYPVTFLWVHHGSST